MKLRKQNLYIRHFQYAPFPKVTLINYLLFLQLLIVPFLETHQINSAEFQAWLITGLVIFPFVICWIYLARYLFIKKYGNQIPTHLLLINGWLVGFSKGFTTQYLANVLYVKDTFPIDEMILRGLSGGALGLALSFAFTLKASFQEDLIASKNLMKKNKELAESIIDLDMEISVLKDISQTYVLVNVVKSLRKDLNLDLLSADPAKNWQKISLALRDNAAAIVRSQSHQLANIKYRKLRPQNYLIETFRNNTLHLHPFTFAFGQFSIGASIIYQDSNEIGTNTQLLANFASTLILTSIVKKIHGSLKRKDPRINLLLVLLLVMVNVLIQSTVSNPLGLDFQPVYLFFVVVWQMFLIYSISSVSELLIFKDDQFRELTSVQEDLIDKVRILEQYNARLRNDISMHLHGYLVGKVLDSSIKLENHGQKGEFAEFNEALAELLSEFSLTKIHGGMNRYEVNTEFYTSCADSWSGILDVEFLGALDFYRKLHTTQRVEIAGVIEELINNANRHGNASALQIQFTWTDSGKVEILAVDNGVGLSNSYVKGLGSSIYGAASDGNWSIENNQGSGVTVRLLIEKYDEASGVLPTDEERAAAAQPVDQRP